MEEMDPKLLQAFLAAGIPEKVARDYYKRARGAKPAAFFFFDDDMPEPKKKYAVRKGKLHMVCRGPIIGGIWAEILTLFDVDCWDPGMVEEAMAAHPDMDVVLHIDSPGGVIYDGARIRSALHGRRANGGKVYAIIEGQATSMAAMITLAADRVLMDEYSLYQFHTPLVYMGGDARELHQTARVMEGWEQIMADTVEERTGISAKKFLDQLEKEQLVAFNAKEASDNGLCHKILDGSEEDALADPAEDPPDDPEDDKPDGKDGDKPDEDKDTSGGGKRDKDSKAAAKKDAGDDDSTSPPEPVSDEGKPAIESTEDDAGGADNLSNSTDAPPAFKSEKEKLEHARTLAAIGTQYPDVVDKKEHSRENEPPADDSAKPTE